MCIHIFHRITSPNSIKHQIFYKGTVFPGERMPDY